MHVFLNQSVGMTCILELFSNRDSQSTNHRCSSNNIWLYNWLSWYLLSSCLSFYAFLFLRKPILQGCQFETLKTAKLTDWFCSNDFGTLTGTQFIFGAYCSLSTITVSEQKKFCWTIRTLFSFWKLLTNWWRNYIGNMINTNAAIGSSDKDVLRFQVSGNFSRVLTWPFQVWNELICRCKTKWNRKEFIYINYFMHARPHWRILVNMYVMTTGLDRSHTLSPSHLPL